MQENKSLKAKTISGIIWRYAERCGAQGIQFIVSIVLARILSPTDFGSVGLITVFITIANVFIHGGFGQSLVQKKDADNVDFSSVFYFNMLMSALLFVAMLFAAPYIAAFYKNLQLTPVIRVLSISLILGSVNAVQQAYVQRTMQFKRFFWATIGGTLLSACTGIYVAYRGGGVWAIVTQQLTNQFFDTLILWVTIKWRPDFVFSFKRMKSLFTYGWKLLCSSLLDTVYNNIYSLVIGKAYSPADLGYYSKGKSFPQMVITNINTTIDSVMLPVLSTVQDEKSRLKSIMRRSIVTGTFLIFPMMAGLIACSRSLVLLLLTEKWLQAVPFLCFCSFTFAFWPVFTANLQAIKAIGRSDIYLKLEIIRKVLGIVILVITLPMGLHSMMWGRCVSTVLCFFINAYPNKKLIGYGYWEQFKDIAPSLVLSGVMCGIVLAFNYIDINIFVKLILQVLVGVGTYMVGAKLFKFEPMEYILSTIRSKRRERREKQI